MKAKRAQTARTTCRRRAAHADQAGTGANPTSNRKRGKDCQRAAGAFVSVLCEASPAPEVLTEPEAIVLNKAGSNPPPN